MKTYISVGIGDMVFLDAILTPEEKESISELYWACRFGHVLIPLLENNPDYPNLKAHYTLDDEDGKKAMESLDPIAIPFWHFRPDFPKNYQVGLKLFGLKEDEVQAINAVGCFEDTTRPYVGSSFIKNANPVDFDNYILFHYPTSTRPRSDIASITMDDWQFVENLSKERGAKVIVISDKEIDVPVTDHKLLVKPSIKYIVDLAASCDYYAGCDSFGAHLAAKVLPKDRLFIKLSPNFTGWNDWLLRAFLPHPPEDVKEFYKSHIGK